MVGTCHTAGQPGWESASVQMHEHNYVCVRVLVYVMCMCSNSSRNNNRLYIGKLSAMG